ncbi:hypothetical protein Droror1_Dr00011847 [Drosera rotundifolia]
MNFSPQLKNKMTFTQGTELQRRGEEIEGKAPGQRRRKREGKEAERKQGGQIERRSGQGEESAAEREKVRRWLRERKEEEGAWRNG